MGSGSRDKSKGKDMAQASRYSSSSSSGGGGHSGPDQGPFSDALYDNLQQGRDTLAQGSRTLSYADYLPPDVGADRPAPAITTAQPTVPSRGSVRKTQLRNIQPGGRIESPPIETIQCKRCGTWVPKLTFNERKKACENCAPTFCAGCQLFKHIEEFKGFGPHADQIVADCAGCRRRKSDAQKNKNKDPAKNK